MIVFKVVADHWVEKVDEDMCPYETLEEFYSDLFDDDTSAINKANELLGKYYCAVGVTKLTVTHKGVTTREKILQKSNMV